MQDTKVIKSTFLLKKEGFVIHHIVAATNNKAGALIIVVRSSINYFFILSDSMKNKLPFILNSKIMHGVLTYLVFLNISMYMSKQF